MTEPEATPPPRPRWVWIVIIAVALGLAVMLMAHLFLDDPMKTFHGGAMPAPGSGAPRS